MSEATPDASVSRPPVLVVIPDANVVVHFDRGRSRRHLGQLLEGLEGSALSDRGSSSYRRPVLTILLPRGAWLYMGLVFALANETK